MSAMYPKFCGKCGAALPPGEPRFCIECGHALRPGTAEAPAPARGGPAGATVRLGNARVEQSVIGGTVQLPSSGAIPPGIWVRDEPPGAEDVVAIYPPLRAVKGGWSGLTGRGWRRVDRAADGARMRFRFVAGVEWFPAPGCGAGRRLSVEVEASSQSAEGKERRGFRYGLRRDGPMRVVAARWQDDAGGPLPQIQIMAPPRVPRVSDLAEEVAAMPDREAALWAAGTLAPGLHRVRVQGWPTQEHTPAGRAITLIPLGEGERAPGWWQRLTGGLATPLYRVRLERPLICSLDEWEHRLPRVRDEARQLGLDLDAAQAAEWWLDRYGHDGVIFSAAQHRFGTERVVVAFRRAQLVRVRG
jgi:hypothetical protein